MRQLDLFGSVFNTPPAENKPEEKDTVAKKEMKVAETPEDAETLASKQRLTADLRGANKLKSKPVTEQKEQKVEAKAATDTFSLLFTGQSEKAEDRLANSEINAIEKQGKTSFAIATNEEAEILPEEKMQAFEVVIEERDERLAGEDEFTPQYTNTVEVTEGVAEETIEMPVSEDHPPVSITAPDPVSEKNEEVPAIEEQVAATVENLVESNDIVVGRTLSFSNSKDNITGETGTVDETITGYKTLLKGKEPSTADVSVPAKKLAATKQKKVKQPELERNGAVIFDDGKITVKIKAKTPFPPPTEEQKKEKTKNLPQKKRKKIV